MRIDFFVGKDQARIAKKIVRRLPTGVRIGEPARIVDDQGNFLGWSICHPDLDGIDQIRLKYVMDTMAANDTVFTTPDFDNDGKITSADIQALKDRIDADPNVAAAERAYRQSLRNA